MGEIDTKPIESVQSAITFFGQSNEQRRSSPTNEKEMDMERELASVRVQLEAKDAVHKQALVKLDHYHKTADELSTLLKNSDVKKNFYINQSHEATARVAELESALAQKSDRLNELERRIVEKSANIDSLQMEMEQAKELLIMSEISAAEAALEVDMMKEEMEAIQRELEKSREAENAAQVEIALLKFQLHKGRSRQAAAEAAEARAQSEKTALFKALQQMGLEAEETKKENRMLKEAAKEEEKEEELMMMMRSDKELEDVKTELEVALSRIGELRTRTEQATSRAEAAEKALEEQNRRRREHKERRKAALRLESVSAKDDDEEVSVKIYQPLGKVLNMKF